MVKSRKKTTKSRKRGGKFPFNTLKKTKVFPEKAVCQKIKLKIEQPMSYSSREPSYIHLRSKNKHFTCKCQAPKVYGAPRKVSEFSCSCGIGDNRSTCAAPPPTWLSDAAPNDSETVAL